MEDNFGGRLSYVMSLRGIRQKELAKAAEVTEATVSRYVNNKRSPDIDFIRTIVSILNVSADYLLGFSENINIGGERQTDESEAGSADTRYFIVRAGGGKVAIKDPDKTKLLDDFFLSLI